MWLKHLVTRGWLFLDTLREIFLTFSKVGKENVMTEAGWLRQTLLAKVFWGDGGNVLKLETGHHFIVV